MGVCAPGTVRRQAHSVPYQGGVVPRLAEVFGVFGVLLVVGSFHCMSQAIRHSVEEPEKPDKKVSIEEPEKSIPRAGGFPGQSSPILTVLYARPTGNPL